MGKRKTKSLSNQIQKTATYNLDLRIHSPVGLSHLGIDNLDSAPAILRLAKGKGLDTIAITDFYTGEFVDLIKESAADSKITVLPGVILRVVLGDCDRVILTCLFPEDADSETISDFLNSINVPEQAKYSGKYIVQTDLDKILSRLKAFGGLVIPSRMDRTPIQKLAIPTLVEKYGLRAFDLAYYPDSMEYFKLNWPNLEFQFFSFSNAKILAQVGCRSSSVKMTKPGFSGLQSLLDQ